MQGQSFWRKTGDGSFVISVEENQGLEKRNTIVTLTAGTAKKTINVMQKGKTAFVEVARTSFEILPEGEIVTLDITANVSYEIEIPSDCQWIRSVETDDASFEVLANESTQERSASLVVKSVCNPVTISVIQKECLKNWSFLTKVLYCLLMDLIVLRLGLAKQFHLQSIVLGQ